MRQFLRLVVLATASVLAPCSASAGPAGHATRDIDLQLVLAADVSGSMNASLRDAQRLGFAAAFRDASLHQAVSATGTIAIVYFEWAGAARQDVIIPWTIVSGPNDLIRLAERLEGWEVGRSGGETSIVGAMLFARTLLLEGGFRASRRVVDISGNGRNTEGPDVAEAIEALREIDATVNGLVLPAAHVEGPYQFTGYDGALIDYYRREVIGGPGAFAIEVDPAVGFADAILRKLVREIAWAASRGHGDG